MNEEFIDYTDRVTHGGDGVYRWYYDMDMYQNKSILYTLEKVNLFTFLGVSIGGALLMGIMAHDFSASIVRGFLLVGLAIGALMALLYLIGFYIAAWIKGGNYRIHFAMREDGLELVWSAKLKEGMETGRQLLSLTGSVIGSRGVRGRWRPTLDEVSNVLFSQVIGYKSHPDWNMIDLSMLGGKFQVYVNSADYDFVEAYILNRVPERVRRAHQ